MAPPPANRQKHEILCDFIDSGCWITSLTSPSSQYWKQTNTRAAGRWAEGEGGAHHHGDVRVALTAASSRMTISPETPLRLCDTRRGCVSIVQAAACKKNEGKEESCVTVCVTVCVCVCVTTRIFTLYKSRDSSAVSCCHRSQQIYQKSNYAQPRRAVSDCVLRSIKKRSLAQPLPRSLPLLAHRAYNT